MSVLEDGALLDPFSVWPAIREPFLGASPAAGASFTQAMEGRYTTRLVSLHCKLVTDANAANREVVLEYRNDQNVRYALMGAATTVPDSTTVYYEFNRSQPVAEWPVDSSILVPIDPMWLPAGWNFRLYVVNVQATDALTEIRGVWERFYTDGAR